MSHFRQWIAIGLVLLLVSPAYGSNGVLLPVRLDEAVERLVTDEILDETYIQLLKVRVEHEMGVPVSEPVCEDLFREVLFLEVYRFYRFFDLFLKYAESVYFLRSYDESVPAVFQGAAQKYPRLGQFIERFLIFERDRRSTIFKQTYDEEMLQLQTSLLYFDNLRERFGEREQTLSDFIAKKKQHHISPADEEGDLDDLRRMRDAVDQYYPVYFTSPVQDLLKYRRGRQQAPVGNWELNQDVDIEVRRVSAEIHRLGARAIEMMKTNSVSFEVEDDLITRLKQATDQPAAMTAIDLPLEAAIQAGIQETILPNLIKRAEHLEQVSVREERGEEIFDPLAMRGNTDFLIELGENNGTGLALANGFPFLYQAYGRLMRDYRSKTEGLKGAYYRFFGKEPQMVDAALFLLPLGSGWVFKGVGVASSSMRWLRNAQGLQRVVAKLPLAQRLVFGGSLSYFLTLSSVNVVENAREAKEEFFSSTIAPQAQSFGQVKALESQRVTHIMGSLLFLGASFAAMNYGGAALSRLGLTPKGVTVGFNWQTIRWTAGQVTDTTLWVLKIGLGLQIVNSLLELEVTQHVRGYAIEAFNSMQDEMFDSHITTAERIGEVPWYDQMAIQLEMLVVNSAAVHHLFVRTKYDEWLKAKADQDASAVARYEREVHTSMMEIASLVYRYREMNILQLQTYLGEMGYSFEIQEGTVTLNYEGISITYFEPKLEYR